MHFGYDLKFGPLCCSAKTWSHDQKRSSCRHLFGSSTASARKHNKYKGAAIQR